MNEVIISSYKTSPYNILKKAIEGIKNNHPTQPFNYNKYSSILLNEKGIDILSLELITKEYDQGYNQLNIPTQRVEQIKWNKKTEKQSFKYTSDFFRFRQNAMQYGAILHKRKYRKFNLKFVKEKDSITNNVYIIHFDIDRKDIGYTNRKYPASYSGTIFINKEDYAILKVKENWVSTLNGEDEVSKYKALIMSDKSNDINTISNAKVKENHTCIYSKMPDGKYYVTNYRHKIYKDLTDRSNNFYNSFFESQSNIYEIETKNIEVIEYEHQIKKATVLNRVKFNDFFWNSFNINERVRFR